MQDPLPAPCQDAPSRDGTAPNLPAGALPLGSARSGFQRASLGQDDALLYVLKDYKDLEVSFYRPSANKQWRLAICGGEKPLGASAGLASAGTPPPPLGEPASPSRAGSEREPAGQTAADLLAAGKPVVWLLDADMRKACIAMRVLLALHVPWVWENLRGNEQPDDLEHDLYAEYIGLENLAG